MNLKRKTDGTAMTVTVAGRIDTATAPEFEQGVKPYLGNITELTLDFKEVNYVSSAGLRALLSLHKLMMKQGGMKLVNVNEEVCDVFEVTGFDEILTYNE